MARCCCFLYRVLYLLSLLSLSDSTRFKAFVDHGVGKQEHEILVDHNVVSGGKTSEEEETSKKVLGGGMVLGSRPPRCPPRCASCVRCEAIQMPAVPRMKLGKNQTIVSSTRTMAGGDSSTSNYKPMSWKCKCGDSIYNP